MSKALLQGVRKVMAGVSEMIEHLEGQMFVERELIAGVAEKTKPKAKRQYKARVAGASLVTDPDINAGVGAGKAKAKPSPKAKAKPNPKAKAKPGPKPKKVATPAPKAVKAPKKAVKKVDRRTLPRPQKAKPGPAKPTLVPKGETPSIDAILGMLSDGPMTTDDIKKKYPGAERSVGAVLRHAKEAGKVAEVGGVVSASAVA